MENAVEALKIAFAVMMFAVALTLSISSFSTAKTSIDTIIMLKDERTQYSYVEPAETLENVVGIETIIPTLYSAYNENFKVVFLDSDGTTPLPLYYSLDSLGNVKLDNAGNKITINTIDLESETHKNKAEAINHLNVILNKRPQSGQKYYNEFIHTHGLYNYLENLKFEEHLGEYYQEDADAAITGTEVNTLEINKTRKRVITYILIDEAS